MAFRRFKGIKLPEQKQGKLFFLLQNYSDEPYQTQMKVVRLCDEIAGEHAAALFELLTRSRSVTITQVSMRYYISETMLNRYRRRFYEAWYKNRRRGEPSAAESVR